MLRQLCAITIAALFAVEPLQAASLESREVNWVTFRQENARRANSRGAAIRLADGTQVKTVVLAILDDGLAVRTEKSTKQFKVKDGRTVIPKDAVLSVQFKGREGHGALYGGLIGAGAGAAAGAGIASGCDDCEAAVTAGLALAMAAMAFGAGVAIGYFSERKIPEYRIVGQ